MNSRNERVITRANLDSRAAPFSEEGSKTDAAGHAAEEEKEEGTTREGGPEEEQGKGRSVGRSVEVKGKKERLGRTTTATS